MVIAGSVPPTGRQDHPLEVFLKYAEPFVCGGAGGVLATTMIQPIDTVKVRRLLCGAFPQLSLTDCPLFRFACKYLERAKQILKCHQFKFAKTLWRVRVLERSTLGKAFCFVTVAVA